MAGFEAVADGLRGRMRTLFTAPAIPFRPQNGGDYAIPSLELCADLGGGEGAGFALHVDATQAV